jgi:hypothetical protein
MDLDFSVLLQPDVPQARVIPYAAFTAGRLYESETWKWSATKTEAHYSYTCWDVGLGGGAKIILSKHSGIRLDFRWLRILDNNRQVPRYTLGYILLI